MSLSVRTLLMDDVPFFLIYKLPCGADRDPRQPSRLVASLPHFASGWQGSGLRTGYFDFSYSEISDVNIFSISCIISVTMIISQKEFSPSLLQRSFAISYEYFRLRSDSSELQRVRLHSFERSRVEPDGIEPTTS